MSHFLKSSFSLFLALLCVTALAQNKSQAYYNDHEAEILPDAQAAFREGEYERAMELCRWHYIIVGDAKADVLREKAESCQELSTEIGKLKATGDMGTVLEKAVKLLALNPEDQAAKSLLSITSKRPVTRETVAKEVNEVYKDLHLEDTVVSGDHDVFDPIESQYASPAIPYEIVSQKPTFHGGEASEFWRWVRPRLVYPVAAKEKGIQGIVTLQFIIEADGQVSNIEILQSDGHSVGREELNAFNKDKKRKDKLLLREFREIYDALDREAVRVVSSSPYWEPGKQDNHPVRVSYSFPVVFELR